MAALARHEQESLVHVPNGEPAELRSPQARVGQQRHRRPQNGRTDRHESGDLPAGHRQD
jgi:hypothetical protein